MHNKIKKIFNNSNKDKNNSCCDFNIETKQKVKNKYSQIIRDKTGSGCCSMEKNELEVPSFGVRDTLSYPNLKQGENVIDIGSGPAKNC
jgi:hypothetical protein